MSGNLSVEENEEQIAVGNVKSVLSAIDNSFDGKRAATVLAETSAKRDEAVMCLRLIAGLNPMLREKAEQTIQELLKVPFAEPDGH